MPKKFRVISQAAPVAGKTKQDVHKALLQMNIRPEQIQLLLFKPLVIKKGLDNAAALEYAEKFSAAGLKVRVETYEVAAPTEVSDEGKQRDETYTSLLKIFTSPVQPAALEEKRPILSAFLGALPAPLIYGGLLLAGTWIWLWYLSSGYAWLFGGLGLPAALQTLVWIFAWLLPAVVGVIKIAFFLYPFWPRRQLEPLVRLDPKRHARFHHLINQMTAAMDVAAPEFIELSSASQVQVAPARGLLSVGRGDLRLSLGLPLISACTVQQLMGLLAHEFGRHADSRASRAAIWIYSINCWFTGRAQMPDEWDERFRLIAEAYPAKPVQWAVAALSGFTRMVRRFLAKLTDLNARATHTTLSRLEIDADQFQLKVSGSAEFAATAELQRRLMTAEKTVRELNRMALYQRDQLLRNLPAAVVDIAQSPQSASELAAANLWEPHPASAERLALAAETRDAGLVANALPASLLFDDFQQLCENITLNDYHRHGIADAAHNRVDNARILEDRAALISKARIDSIQQGEPGAVNADGSVEWTGQP